MSARSTLRLLVNLPAVRRVAAERGEVRRVWPDVLADMAGVVFWRTLHAVLRQLPPRPRPHVETCPLCMKADDRGHARQ